MKADRPRAPTDDLDLDPFLRLLEERFALKIAPHQLDRMATSLRALLGRTDYPSPAALVDALAGARSDLLTELATGLTIHETHFFRVEPQIRALRATVLPELIVRRSAERRLRLWSAGCSTGEEAYTLAILLREQLPAPELWDVELLGTDVSELALATARRASYGEWSFRDTPERIRQIYFRPEGRSWRLIEPIRRMARFERHNLATDPVPWSDAAGRPGIDLILCRNVAIYFESAAAQRIYRRLAEAIRESGWLVLGPSDPMPQHPELLTPAYLPGAVLWRRAEPRSARPPGTTRSAASAGGPEPVRRAGARPPTPAAAARAAGPSPAPPGVAASVPAAPTTDEAWRLAQAGEQAAARDCAQRLVEARPAEAGAHLLLGLLLLDEGEGARAAESLRRAAFLDATNPLAHFGLARALAGLGEGRRARSALARAGQLLAAQPDDQPVPAGGGMTAGELRRAVDAQLAAAADGSAR